MQHRLSVVAPPPNAVNAVSDGDFDLDAVAVVVVDGLAGDVT